MVTESRNGTRSRDTRNGDGVSARFRPLGAAGGDGPADPAPPEFATAPWGYRRAEVDAWASWVAGIVAQARAETVRADSAEATLRATLDRLDRLERPTDAEPTDATPAGAAPTGTTPAGTTPAGTTPAGTTPTGTTPAGTTPTGTRPAGQEPADRETERRTDDCGGLPRRAVRSASARWSMSGPDIEAVRDPDPGSPSGTTAPGPPPSRTPGDTRTEPTHGSTTTRLQIVESTLHEVMQLLNRLVAAERPDPDRSPAGR